jgi:alpha-tubulin suppressor-like RCC1 family protein
VRCWGDNQFGQNGNGSPSGIFAPPTAVVTGITSAIGLTSGAEHSCALLPGGRVQCWGRGLHGRLGDGTTDVNAVTPVTVVGLGVTWTSSDPTVATIDATGLATGRSPGSTTIGAAADGRSGSTTLTVQ